MKTRNLSHVHIQQDGTIVLWYKKRDTESGKEIEWHEIQQDKIPVKISAKNKDYQFQHICMHNEIAQLIKQVISIEVYPDNPSELTKRLNIHNKTVYLQCKDFYISFHEKSIGKNTFYNNQVCICER